MLRCSWNQIYLRDKDKQARDNREQNPQSGFSRRVGRPRVPREGCMQDGDIIHVHGALTGFRQVKNLPSELT